MDPVEVVQRWVDAFNRRDLEGVLELYDEKVRTESPLLLKLGEAGSCRLEGKPALREYFGRALSGAPADLHFTPLHLMSEGDVVLLEYEREAPQGGSPAVAERFVIRDGKIVESRVFWNADKIRDSLL